MRKLLCAALPFALFLGAAEARAEVMVSGAGYLKGALICPNGYLLDVAADLIRRDTLVQLIDPVSRRNWEAMYGSAHFDPESVGCALAPPGTHLRVIAQVGPLYHVAGSGYDGYATSMGLTRTGDQ